MNRNLGLSCETVPLQKAVLCVDCELVTESHSDVCPVCGGHSLLPLAGIVGGALVDLKNASIRQQRLFLFNLHIEIDVAEMQGGELGGVIEGLSKIIAAKLGNNRASFHIVVDPIGTTPATLRAA